MANKLKGRSDKQAILVLGMHRSGTSALTGLLEMFGAATPQQQIPASAQNAKGFFEAVKVARLNDKLLLKDGLTWDSWGTVRDQSQDSDQLKFFIDQACDILQNEFGTAKLVALKDPRICRLVPFWSDALRTWKRTPLYVLALRHPMEVAQSLETRNGFGVPQALLLWMAYVLDSEANTRGLPRATTTFDLLLTDPTGSLKKIHQTLGLPMARPTKERQKEIGAFLAPNLRHHEGATLENTAQVVVTTYTVMARWAKTGEDPADYRTLDRIRAEFQAVCAQKGDADQIYAAVQTLDSDLASETLPQTLATAAKLTKPNLLSMTEALVRANAALSAAHFDALVQPAQKEDSAEPQIKGQGQQDATAQELAQLSQLYLQEKSIAEGLRHTLTKAVARETHLTDDVAKLTSKSKNDQRALGTTSRENTELHALVAKVETERARLQGENTELHALVKKVETERVRLQGENTELHALVKKVETERARLQGENTELHALVKKVETERARLQSENTKLHALVSKVETERARLQDENAELHALVAKVETERARLQDENTELHALVAKVEEARHALVSSFSWRISRPLRILGRLLGK